MLDLITYKKGIARNYLAINFPVLKVSRKKFILQLIATNVVSSEWKKRDENLSGGGNRGVLEWEYDRKNKHITKPFQVKFEIELKKWGEMWRVSGDVLA